MIIIIIEYRKLINFLSHLSDGYVFLLFSQFSLASSWLIPWLNSLAELIRWGVLRGDWPSIFLPVPRPLCYSCLINTRDGHVQPLMRPNNGLTLCWWCESVENTLKTGTCKLTLKVKKMKVRLIITFVIVTEVHLCK